MNKTKFACLLLGLLFLQTVRAQQANFLFIITDDQTYNAIHALGNHDVHTPTLDEMVEEGVTFNQGSWSGAVCLASRCMINTGQSVFRAARNFTYLPNWGRGGGEETQVPLWGATLRQHGYETFLTGKWHLSNEAALESFDFAHAIGEGDFGKTVDISTRAGQDSDCNPSNAAGILGTMLGYNQIPAFWKQGLDKVEDIDFSHTDISLNDVYAIGYRHAVEMIQQNGGSTQDTALTIRFQSPATVAFEESFPGIYPLARTSLEKAIKADNPELTFDFEGCGFAMNGQAYKAEGKSDILLEIEVFVDGKLTETLNIPTEFLIRKRDIAFNFELPEGKHTVTLKAKNVPQDYLVHFWDMVTYSTTNPGSKAFEATPKKG